MAIEIKIQFQASAVILYDVQAGIHPRQDPCMYAPITNIFYLLLIRGGLIYAVGDVAL